MIMELLVSLLAVLAVVSVAGISILFLLAVAVAVEKFDEENK